MRKNIIVTGLLCLSFVLSGANGVKASTTAEPAGLPKTGEIAMYRVYNPNSGEHFYTGNASERDHLVSIGWRDEGVGWIAPTSGKPVYRLYNPSVGDHLYTKDSGERNALVKAGWRYESVCWYSDTSETTPVYRQYNRNAVTGTHNFTASANEKSNLTQAGWADEGVAWYAKSVAAESVKDAMASNKTQQNNSIESRAAQNMGTVGNLIIDAIGTNVALNNNGSAQAIVDRVNSAAYLEGWATPIIADHRHQSNFKKLTECKGQYAYVTIGGKTTRYQCVNMEAGKNNGSSLVTASGKDVTSNKTCDLVMYTCQSDSEGVNIWITEWNVA